MSGSQVSNSKVRAPYQTIAQLGHSGWELVGIMAPGSGGSFYYYFKRPLPERP